MSSVAEPDRDDVDAWSGPALLEFGTSWCGFCRAAQPAIAAALAAHPGVRHVRVEDGSGRRLGRSFGVKLWPTLVFLRDGKEVERQVRPGGAREIERALAAIDPGTPCSDGLRMKIATYNVNGITSRLPRLLEWLSEAQPDVACLQELKTSDETFPRLAIEAAGYGAIWHGQKGFNGVAVLAKGAQPVETRRGLPGDPDDTHSRYLEAEVFGLVVASIYLPNGNPQPGPKFDYKLRWFERLIEHAAGRYAEPRPVLLIGDYNVVASDGPGDIYNPASWKNDALLQPETRAAWQRLLAQGWTDAIRHLHPDERIYTFWDFFRNRYARDAGLRIDHLLLNPAAKARLKEAGVDRAVRGREKPSDHAPTWVVLD